MKILLYWKKVLCISILVPSLGVMSQANAKGGEHSGMQSQSSGNAGIHKTLSKDQRKRLVKLRVGHRKAISVAKVKRRKLKIELALLVASDNPVTSVVTSKVNQILAIHKSIFMAGVLHKISVRKILTPLQRSHFDMRVLGNATRGRSHHKKMHRKRHPG